MSKRDKERKESLDALARIATASGYGAPKPAPAPAPAPRPAAPRPPPAPVAKPKPAPAPTRPVDAEAERRRRLQMEERRLKLEEERRLRQRRENELARGQTLQWRGMSLGDVPVGVRRTAWDREPTLDQKVHDVLGAAKQKEGRAKNRDKGRRQGGR